MDGYMNKFACCLAVLSISLSSISAYAQSTPLQYPQLNVPDRGARLGVSVDGPYTWNGIQVLKVINVAQGSGLYGVVYPGDYIYGVNGFNLRSNDDLFAIISYGAPGSVATVYYLDSRRNYATMKVTVRTTSDSVFNQVATSNSGTNSTSFCEEHYIICGVGLLLGAAVVASAVSGSGSSSGSSNYTTNNDPDRYRQRQDNSSSSTPPAEKPRTYGLYGDCPQPGAGYGC
jgi:hypothetical protein